MEAKRKKILAVASIGGHWVQLLRIAHPLEERYEVVYMSTAIVTSGAAPGLLTIILGRMTGTKTIWADSVANVQTMSACGKLARKFATHVYTQWPGLATAQVHYAGNIFGD